MVIDQKLLNSQMMKYNIGSNVLNQISGQQAQTPVQQPTPTVQQPIQQPIQQTQITNKTPVYDIKSMMGFSPQATKNQISTMTQFAQQQQANRPQANIQTFEPMTNNEGLTVHKTASFKDLVIDLKNGADQGGSLSFMKFRDLYPEYVENWDEVLDLYESIKANPNYTTEQITQNAQKQYPELFGNTDTRFSAYDRELGLKKLYDEMVSNQKSGQAKLTRQDIINNYPEFANTQDISTIEEIQDMIYDYKNLPTKKMPTYVDIAENFGDLFEGEDRLGQTMVNELNMLDNISETQYKALSNEGQEYVKSLANLKGMVDTIRRQYKIAEDVTDRDIINAIKEISPELYNEAITTTTLQGNDRTIMEKRTTEDPAFIKGSKAVVTKAAERGTQTLQALGDWGGRALERKLNIKTFGLAPQAVSQITDPIKRAAKTSTDWLDQKLEDSKRYNQVALSSEKSIKQALKDGDRGTVATHLGEAVGSTLPAIILSALTGGGALVAGASFLPSSSQRALEDIENDPKLANLSDEQKHNLALLQGGVESAIEGLSFAMVFPGLSGRTASLLERMGGQGFKRAMSNALIKGVTQAELGALSEGGEEVLQHFFSNLIAKGAGSDRDLGTAKEYWDIFTETFLSSQLVSMFGGVGEGVRQNQQNKITKQELNRAKNTVIEGQVNAFDNYEDYNKAMKDLFEDVTDKELADTWNNVEQKKYDLAMQNGENYDKKTVDVPVESLSEQDNKEYNDILNEMIKNREISQEQKTKIMDELGITEIEQQQREQPQTEGLAEVSEKQKTAKKTGWRTRKMSGLDKETITRIENNPYISNYWNKAVNMVEKEGLSMDNGKIIEQPMQELGEELLKSIEKAEKDLGEDGKMYKLIKNIKQTYDLSDSRKGIEGVLKKYDITTNKEGKLDYSNSQFIKAEDTNAISRAVELLNNTDLANITPKQYWNLRKKLSSLSGFDKGTSKDGEAVVRQLRYLVDQLAKDNIPGLKKVDEIFSKEIKYLEEIKQGLVYQQGIRKGEIKDNFYSILKTINNQNRQQMNQRLEKIMPDLSDRVEAINMLPKLLKAYAVKSRLVEVGARNIGKVGGVVAGGIPGLVVGYVFDEITGKVSKNLRKSAINNIVNNMSDTAKQRLEDIATKKEEKETLTQEERDTLNQIKAEIEKIIEQEDIGTESQGLSEAEKKSETKNTQNEQVQGLAKINKNKEIEVKGLGEISSKEKKTGKIKKNEYNDGGIKETDQSAISPSNDGELAQVVSFFSKPKKINTDKKHLKTQREITRNGKTITSNVRKGDQFSNIKDLGIQKGNENYLENLKKVINGDKEGVIGKINIKGIDFEIKLNEHSFLHLFNKHGDFNLNNLITSTNHPDYKIIDAEIYDDDLGDYVPVKNKINLFKSLDNNHFLVVGANLENGYYIATHFEVVDKKGNKLKEYISRGTPLDKKTTNFMSEKGLTRALELEKDDSGKKTTIKSEKSKENFIEQQAKEYKTAKAFVESAIAKDFNIGDNIEGIGTIQDTTETQAQIKGQWYSKKILGDNLGKVTLNTIRNTIDKLRSKTTNIGETISARRKAINLVKFLESAGNKEYLASIGFFMPAGDSSGAEGYTFKKGHARDITNLKEGIKNAEKAMTEYWNNINGKKQAITVYRGTKGGEKRYNFTAYTTNRSIAKAYGNNIETKEISPNKLADFTNPTDELIKIVKNTWGKDFEWMDKGRIQKILTSDNFSLGTNAYDIVENEDLQKELKQKGYDFVKFKDFVNDKGNFRQHESYFELSESSLSNTIGGKDITQIKQEAVQQGLAEISKPQTKEYTVDKGKVKENF